MPDEEKIPAQLKLELLKAEEEINKSIPKVPDWKNGRVTAVIAGAAFFAVGIAAHVPIASVLGFAAIGTVVGLLVGAYRKPGQYGK